MRSKSAKLFKFLLVICVCFAIYGIFQLFPFFKGFKLDVKWSGCVVLVLAMLLELALLSRLMKMLRSSLLISARALRVLEEILQGTSLGGGVFLASLCWPSAISYNSNMQLILFTIVVGIAYGLLEYGIMRIEEYDAARRSGYDETRTGESGEENR